MEPASALTSIINSYSNLLPSAVAVGPSVSQVATLISEYVTRLVARLNVGSHPDSPFKLQERSSAEPSHSAISGMRTEKLINAASSQSIFSRVPSSSSPV